MNGKRRLVLLFTALALLLTGCFGGGDKTNITKYHGCAAPVSARFYYGGNGSEKNIEELSPDQLSALIADLDAMTYKTHFFHTDYYWAGQFGLELTLADCTFWNYDGTELELRRVSITKYHGCAEPVSARFYYGGNGSEKNIEELSPDQLSALIADLDAMTYKTHFFHTDYYWAGQFGLELTLADGTFWNYDGTELELRRVSITETRDDENRITGDFAEITGGDFWETISKYFESAAEMEPMGTW